MRCKACDTVINRPIKVVDEYDGSVHEEDMCKKCNTYSFSAGSIKTRQGEYALISEQLARDGFISIDNELGDYEE